MKRSRDSLRTNGKMEVRIMDKTNLEKMLEEWVADPTPERIESWRYEICTTLSSIRHDLLPSEKTYEASEALVRHAIKELKYLIEICEEALKDE